MGQTMAYRGEIWQVNLDPTVGKEIRKSRPAVIISSDSLGRIGLRIIVPITTWKPEFARYPWMIRIPPDTENSLSHESGANALQVRSVDRARLVRRIGELSPSLMEEIAAAVAICIEYK
jgi:mRNA interferase MazF